MDEILCLRIFCFAALRENLRFAEPDISGQCREPTVETLDTMRQDLTLKSPFAPRKGVRSRSERRQTDLENGWRTLGAERRVAGVAFWRSARMGLAPVVDSSLNDQRTVNEASG
jgi:hypothetical protein